MNQLHPRSPDGRRCADQGNGTFLNPVVAGDHPDPTILKDGQDYYMTCSSFLACPGIVIRHSRDLVNWTPVCTALQQPLGSVWAMDLVKYQGRYFIYIPAMGDTGSSIHVIHADCITGPWSDPVDLQLPGCIDPGHAVGEDGKRYLFVNGIRRIGLTDDGLATVGSLEQVYQPWQYPAEWEVEMFAPEGPKILRRGDWFYLISAVGGTAGPATSHMVIMARSRSIHGPWTDCPRNPLVRTWTAAEPWWSRGHASLVEGPAGDWWMVYHGYENGYRTLGRQTLLEPVSWDADGWPRAEGGDLSAPLAMPRQGQASPAGLPLSGSLRPDQLGLQWAFFNPGPAEAGRLAFREDGVCIRGSGTGPADSSPLCAITGDRDYRVEVSLETSGQATGGLILYYCERMFCGFGFSPDQLITWNYGQEHSWMRQTVAPGIRRLCLENRHHVVTMHYSLDGHSWQRHPWQMETSGMHHNVFGGFTCLKIGLLACGPGSVTFSQLVYAGEQNLT